MHSTRPALVVSVVLALLFAGCLTAPADGPAPAPADPPHDRTASYTVSNEDTRTYAVTLSFAPSIDGLAVTFSNGSTAQYPDVSSLDELPQSTVSRAVRVVPLGDDVQTFTHRLSPGTGVGNTVSSLPRDAVLVYTIATPGQAEPMRSVGVDTCGTGTTESTHDIRIDSSQSVGVGTTCSG